MIEFLDEFWPQVSGLLAFAAALAAAVHILLNKRDSRAATGWIGVVWLAPVLGPALYVLFGVNRIRRRAARLREGLYKGGGEDTPPGIVRSLPPEQCHLGALVGLADRVTRRPLTAGNRIEVFQDAREAYAGMLRAIAAARRSVSLMSYLFIPDDAGAPFVEELIRAHRRGAAVRVLVDAVGAKYSLRRAVPRLRRAGIAAEHFLPTWMPWGFPYVNLRNHKKILIVDGAVGFTGGLNIHDGCLARAGAPEAVRDVHFSLEGPVVAHLQETFCEDWRFSAGENLSGEDWFPRLEKNGAVLARGVTDGPDEDYAKLRWTLLGAIECAQRSIRIVTPYFLPDDALSTALGVAAMTGIEVDIVLPEKNNHRLVQWAGNLVLSDLVARGCRVWLSPPPFDHAKLVVVDGAWTLLGSGNWDARSLDLNFEFNVECYDAGLAGKVEKIMAARKERARRLHAEEMTERGVAWRLRDGAARLLLPYL